MFLIQLLFFVLLFMLLRGLIAAMRVRNTIRDAFSAGQDTSRQRARRRSGSFWSAAPSRKAKKIDPEVGEYVKFTDVDAETASTDEARQASSSSQSAHRADARTRSHSEAQVVDVEWTDITD
jgi:hypothetical protein